MKWKYVSSITKISKARKYWPTRDTCIPRPNRSAWNFFTVEKTMLTRMVGSPFPKGVWRIIPSIKRAIKCPCLSRYGPEHYPYVKMDRRQEIINIIVYSSTAKSYTPQYCAVHGVQQMIRWPTLSVTTLVYLLNRWQVKITASKH